MAIAVIVQYNGGFIPDNLLLTQAPIVWFNGIIIVYYSYLFHYVLQCLLFCIVWWPGMAINVSVQKYNGGFLPDNILLTQGYYLRGTRLNAMEDVLFLQPTSMKQQFYTRMESPYGLL